MRETMYMGGSDLALTPTNHGGLLFFGFVFGGRLRVNRGGHTDGECGDHKRKDEGSKGF